MLDIGMDFHCMKRKQLQALCKKHKIPANSSNLEMANKLTECLKEKENSVMMDKEENASEGESNNLHVDRKVKKVRFSPDNELIEFTRSKGLKKSRINSICRRESKWSIEIVDSGERNKETVGKTTRSRESKKMEYEVKSNNGKAIVSTVETFDDDKVEEGGVVDSGRVVRTRRKMEGQGFKNVSKIEKKEANDGDKRDEKASDGVNSEKQKEIVDNHSRVTRSRAQRLAEAPAEMGKRGRKVVRDIGKVAAVSTETVENGESGADSSSKRGGKCDGTSATGSDEKMKTNGEALKENLVKKQTNQEDVTVVPQVLLRRSKRKANMVGECAMFIDDKKKHENGEIKGSLQKPKLLASDDSPLDAEVIQNEVNIGTRAVLKAEEPHKRVEPRRSNRRNTVIESDDLRADTGTRYPLRSSMPLSDIAPEVCKVEKNVLQPFGIMRRSRRKTCLKLDSGNVIDSAAENIMEEKYVSEVCIAEKDNSAVQKNTRSRRNTSKCKPPGITDKINGDFNTHQKNKVTKRKRCHVSAGDVLRTNDDLDAGAQPLNGSSTKKVMSAAATGKFVDEGKQQLSVDYPNVLDASCHGSSGNGESQFLDVQLSVSNIIGDVDLTSFRKTDKKKEEVSLADSLGSSCMNLIDGEELAKADTNAIELLETDSTFSKDQTCGTNSLSEGEVQEPTVKNITEVDNKINDQLLAEDKTHSSAGSVLLGAQTVVMTNLKVAETEADEHAQPCPRVIDHHNDLDNSNKDASKTAGEDKTFVSRETDYTHSRGTSKLKVPSSSIARLHVHNVAEGNEVLFHKDIASKLAEADEDGCSKERGNVSNHFSEFDRPDLCHSETREGESSNGRKSNCEEHGVFILANLFGADRRYGITPQGREKFSDEHSVKDFDDQGVLHGSASGALITMCYSTGDNEANLSAEGGRTYCKDKQSESTEADESGCMKSHKSSKDEDWVSSIFSLFDEEKSAKIEPKPKDIGVVSDKCSIKDLDEHEIFDNLPDVSTTVCENYAEVKSGRYSSNLQETNPATPSSVSETQAKQTKSLSAKYDTVANTNQAQEAWSHASELEGNAVFFLKNYPEGKISQVAQGLSADKDVNHANYGLDTEDSTGACISDVKNRTASKGAAGSLSDVKFQDLVGTEQKHEKLLTTQTESDASEKAVHAKTQSWTEIELYNLFGTTSDEDAPPGLGDTFCQGTEIANMTISNHKSTPSNSGSLNKRKGKEMEGDSRSECAKRKNKDVVLPTAFDADISGNELKFLFATPVKIMTPRLIEETHSYNRIFNRSVTPVEEFLDTLKKDVATEHTANGKGEHAGYEIENNLCMGASLSDNRADNICKESNEIESFKLLNTSTTIHSGAEYCEGLEDHLAQNKEEVLQATNLITEDKKEHVIPLAKSCLHGEARNTNIISSSGSPCDSYELESFAGMPETLSYKSKANKSDGEMKQKHEVVVELSDAGLQKSSVSQNMNLLTAASDDVNILRETSIETSGDPEVAKVGSFHKDVSDKGISPVLFWDASPDCEESIRESDDQSEAKIWDEKDSNPKLSQDTYDELHTNNEKVTEVSGLIGYNLGKELDQLQISDEPKSTFEEAKGMYMTTQILHDTDAAAEHESGPLSNSAMPSCLCYHEDGDKNLEAGELADNGGKDTCEMINRVESIELNDNSIEAMSETAYDVCEASEELTEKTAECQKETNSITEDNEEKVIPLGQTCLSDEARDHASANIISLSGSPNNLDKLGGCQDMSIDTALSESLSCKSIVDHKCEQEIQNSEAASELCDADLQNSNFCKTSRLISCSEDDSSKEASHNTFGGPLVAELTNTGCFEGPNDTEKGTCMHHSPKVSKDLNGAKISDAKSKSSKGMSDEPHVNSEVKGLSALSDSDNLLGEADKLPCSIELESTSLEAKGLDTTTPDLNTVVAPAEHGSSLCGAVSSMLSSSEMILHLRDESNDVENLSRDEDKNSEKAEGNSTAQMVEFSMELHFEENEEVFNNDALTISNLPTSGYSKTLKECDVADTIKEYIDSESSLSVIFENSSTNVPVDMLAHTDEGTTCENSASSKHGDDIARRLTDEDSTLSVNCFESETKEQEEAGLFIEPQVSGNAVDSPRCVGFLAEGSPMKLDCQKKIDSIDGHELQSTTRKNARTILIHGTPGKLPIMQDMKENAPKHKSSNMGDITAVRPAKRRALQDVRWK